MPRVYGVCRHVLKSHLRFIDSSFIYFGTVSENSGELKAVSDERTAHSTRMRVNHWRPSSIATFHSCKRQCCCSPNTNFLLALIPIQLWSWPQMTRSFRTTRDGMFGAAFNDKVDRVAINAHAPMPKVSRETPLSCCPPTFLSLSRGSLLVLSVEWPIRHCLLTIPARTDCLQDTCGSCYRIRFANSHMTHQMRRKRLLLYTRYRDVSSVALLLTCASCLDDVTADITAQVRGISAYEVSCMGQFSDFISLQPSPLCPKQPPAQRTAHSAQSSRGAAGSVSFGAFLPFETTRI